MCKKYFIILAILTFFVGPKVNGMRNRDMPLSKVFNNALESLAFDIYNQFEYKDSLTSSGFDFHLFEPIKGKEKENEYCKLYYNESMEVARIDYYSNVKGENITFLMFHADDFIFYNAYVYNSKNHTLGDGYFVRGFFCYDKALRINTFFALKPQSFIKSEFPNTDQADFDLGGTLLTVSQKLETTSIYKTFMLDSVLNVESRINWIDNEFLTFSEIKKEGGTICEEVVVYSKDDCEFCTSLDRIKLRDFYYLLDGRGCNKEIRMLAYPLYDPNENLPLWTYPGLMYRIQE